MSEHENNHHRQILDIWPDAEHITPVGVCDCCKGGSEYFFTLPKYFKLDAKGYAHGGYYCVDCKFSNAGCYPAELVVGLDLGDLK